MVKLLVNLHRCEMCGREVSHLVEIEIEGARLLVCSSCSRHGKKVVKKTVSQPKKRFVRGTAQASKTPITTRERSKKTIRSRSEETIVLAEDYDKRLRLARQKLNLSQKDVANKTKISASNIQSFELKKLRPTDEQIKILEKFFGITLTEKIIDYGSGEQKSSKGYQTLGDIVVIKKKTD